MPPIAALDPAGPFAQPLSDLSWLLIVAVGLVLAVVVAATLVAIFARGLFRRLVAAPAIVVIGGLVFPVVVLSSLLAWSLNVTERVTEGRQPGDLMIRVTGEMWWWRVHYMDGDRVLFETANQIHIPVGRPVALELTSNDVIHAFWIPSLGGKMDMIPGRRTRLVLHPTRTGTFRGQCAEYCGASHALMAFPVVVMEAEDFARWLDAQREPAADSAEPLAVEGRESFFANGCSACHAIRGTDLRHGLQSSWGHDRTFPV